jgi:21S rRNA (GM2251-2'-O)-methyltransferase
MSLLSYQSIQAITRICGAARRTSRLIQPSRSLSYRKNYQGARDNDHYKRKDHYRRDDKRDYNSDDNDNVTVVYGTQPVLAALEAKRRQIFKLFVKEESEQRTVEEKKEKHQVADLFTQLTAKQPIQLTRSELNNLTNNGAHQGVVLQVSPLDFVPIDWMHAVELDKTSRPPLWIALDQIQDPQNFGAVLRSCAYFGVDGVVVPHKDTSPLSAVVSKASAGAMELLPVHQAGHFERYLKQSKANGWSIVGTANEGDTGVQSVFDLSLTQPTILILGNEGRGMASRVRELCDKLITIPTRQHVNMKPARLDSLNVSVATGVILSHLTRDK